MWPQEYIELKHIDNLLVCGICYEYMDTSVITLCSHNYCSLCIRKYLHYKTQCPACFTETFEKDLRKNKILDEIIAQFLKIKDKLKICLRSQVMFMQNNQVENISNTPKSVYECKDIDTSSQRNNIIHNSPKVESNSSSSLIMQKETSSPSTSAKSWIPLMFTPKSYKRSNKKDVQETKVVICPVCDVTVSEVNINRHLDDCLKRETVKHKPQIVELKREPLPKLVFSLMKDAMIKKKLKEFGLSLQGDRRTMEARLQRYIVLYNAECDKSNPRSILELVKQCEDEENLEKRINKTSLFLNKLQINRNMEQSIIDDERRKYLETHKNSFEVLISKIKSIDPSKRSSARCSLLFENIDNNEDVPHNQQVEVEDSDEATINAEKHDFQSLNSAVYIQDSDSDTSCPLQTYSSTDPHEYLSVELRNRILQNQSQSNFEQCTNKNELNCSSPTRIGKTNISQRKIVNESVLDKDEIGNERVTSNLQEIVPDVSSGHNSNSKRNYKERRTTYKSKYKSVTNALNMEEESDSMLPECSVKRRLRPKRNCDTVQNDNQVILSKRRRLKKSTNKEELAEEQNARNT